VVNANDQPMGVVLADPAENRAVIVRFRREARVRHSPSALGLTARDDISAINQCIIDHGATTLTRLFPQTEDALDRDVASLAAATNVSLNPLSVYYHLTATDSAQAESLRDGLNEDPTVEEVYVAPRAVPAIFVEPAAIIEEEAPESTVDFTGRQAYLDAAPGGIDARFAWTLPGGKGDKVQVIDIEGGWNFSHEDLIKNQGGIVGGTATTEPGWESHGTAVQGEIAGDENQFGVIGIAPQAKFSAVSIFGDGNSSAKAIKTAADKLSPGDIILVELHAPGPNANGVGQFGLIPVEYWSAEFDAIKYATAKGIIVIEAAGNGFQDLDDPVYQGKFDRANRDSGAILVGAGAPPSGNHGPDRSRLDFSNYGAIVDAQGWGTEVTTTGYGDLTPSTDKNRRYTGAFNGTSSAAPIVAGAIACLQSVRLTRGEEPLTGTQIREMLRSTGSAQTSAPARPSDQRIGNRPNLAEMLNEPEDTVANGVASQYWDETLAYPPGTVPKLWLLVDGSWKELENPSQGLKDLVQRAFLGSGSFVRVWYKDSAVVALVVEGSRATGA